GLFDGSPSGYRQVGWKINGDQANPVPIESFFSDFFRPGLAREILEGRHPEAPRDIWKVDRRQPILDLSVAEGNPPALVRERTIKLKIHASVPPRDAAHREGGVVRDVRLFRNGSLVWHGHGWLASGTDAKFDVVVNTTVVAGLNEFRAYAFNEEDVQSS